MLHKTWNDNQKIQTIYFQLLVHQICYSAIAPPLLAFISAAVWQLTHVGQHTEQRMSFTISPCNSLIDIKYKYQGYILSIIQYKYNSS